jgi:diacylglycerol O-acyltransferase / wax synthase
MAKHAMSSADAAWLRMDSPTNLMVVNSVLWFEEPVDWERLRGVLEERIVERFPRFRQIAVEPAAPRSPHWEDCVDFDMDLHLHHIALPAPGDDEALRELMSDLMSTPLDRTKPLWQMYLVDGYRGGAALVCRIHHAVADGIALTRVMMLLTDSSADAQAAQIDAPSPEHHASRLRSAAHVARAGSGRILHESFESALHPGHIASIAAGVTRELAGDTRALAKLLLAGTDTETVLRGPLVARNRVAWSNEIPLADVKAIGHRADATVNDVLIAAVSGSISNYLGRHGSHEAAVHAMVPFNLRPFDEPVDPQLGNRFALVLLTLPTVHRDPLVRLTAAKREMDAIKRSREPAVAYGILSMIGVTPSQVEARLVNMFADKTSLVLTNVPGPRNPVYVAGAKVAGVLPWAPCSGSLGMTVTIFSYAGGIRVGFMTDARRVPDPETLARGFEREFHELRSAVTRRARRSDRQSARTQPHASA